VRGLRMGEVKEASASIVVHAPIADVCSKSIIYLFIYLFIYLSMHLLHTKEASSSIVVHAPFALVCSQDQIKEIKVNESSEVNQTKLN